MNRSQIIVLMIVLFVFLSCDNEPINNVEESTDMNNEKPISENDENSGLPFEEYWVTKDNITYVKGGLKEGRHCFIWLYFNNEGKLICKEYYNDSCNKEKKIFFGNNQYEINEVVLIKNDSSWSYLFSDKEEESKEIIVKNDFSENCLSCHSLGYEHKFCVGLAEIKEKYSFKIFSEHFELSHDTIDYSLERLKTLYNLVIHL